MEYCLQKDLHKNLGYIKPCTDMKLWQPSPESKYLLNAQPAPLLTSRPIPLNISFFKYRDTGRDYRF